MRLLIGLSLILGGLSGIAVSLLSDVTVASDLYFLDGWELSPIATIFSGIAILGGILNFTT